MNKTQASALALATLVVAVISACGDASAPPVSDAFVIGTAAYGAPMAGAEVTVADANGKTATVTADDQGHFSAKVTGFSAPLLVTATATSGDAVISCHAITDGAIVAGTVARVSVTPLTDAVVALASSDGRSSSGLDGTVKPAGLDPGRLSKATAALTTTIADVVAALATPAVPR